MGKAVYQFREARNDIQREIMDSAKEITSSAKEVRKEVENAAKLAESQAKKAQETLNQTAKEVTGTKDKNTTKMAEENKSAAPINPLTPPDSISSTGMPPADKGTPPETNT